MTIDYTVPTIYASLGIPLLISYSLLAKETTAGLNSLWTNNGSVQLNKPVYLLSIVLATIAGLYLMYYFSYGNSMRGMQDKNILGMKYNTGKYLIYFSILLFIGFSLLWLPAFKLTNKLITNSVLFVVGIGCAMLLAIIASGGTTSTDDKIAIAAACYLTFHTIVLDGFMWTGII